MSKTADALLESIKGWVQRSIQPLADRISDASRRTDLLGERIEQLEAMAKSLEHRASRHTDHLRALETRLKRLEHE